MGKPKQLSGSISPFLLIIAFSVFVVLVATNAQLGGPEGNFFLNERGDVDSDSILTESGDDFASASEQGDAQFQSIVPIGSLNNIIIEQPDFVDGVAVSHNARQIFSDLESCEYELTADSSDAFIGQSIRIAATAQSSICNGREISFSLQNKNPEDSNSYSHISAIFSNGQAVAYLFLPKEIETKLIQNTGQDEGELFIQAALEINDPTQGPTISVRPWKEDDKIVKGTQNKARLFVTFEGELIGDSIQITDYSYSCARPEDDAELFDTLQENMRNSEEFPSPNAKQFRTASYGSFSYPLEWRLLHELPFVPDLGSEETVVGDDHEHIHYASYAFLEVDDCSLTSPITLSSTDGLADQTLLLSPQKSEAIFGNVPESGITCETLKPATSTVGKEWHVILATDASFDEFVYGTNPYWGSGLSESDVRQVLLQRAAQTFLEYPPYSNNRDSIAIHWVKDTGRYPCLTSRTCPRDTIYANSIRACGLQGQQNVFTNILITPPPKDTSRVGGWAYYNSRQSVTILGKIIAFYIEEFAKIQVKVPDDVLLEWKKMLLEYTPEEVMTHELGHALYALPHSTGEFFQVDFGRVNHPQGLFWKGSSAQETCKRVTGDECYEVRKGSLGRFWLVVTSTDKKHNSFHNYMYAATGGDRLNDVETSYQKFGKHHVPNNIHAVQQKRMGLVPSRFCGDGIVDEGEDVDFLESDYPYDFERDVAGYCVQAYNEMTEVHEQNPLSLFETETSTQRNLRKGEPIIDSGIVTLNTKNCRLHAPCVRFNGTWYSNAQKTNSGGLVPKNREDDPYGFKEGSPNDCSLLDYRFEQGRKEAFDTADNIPIGCDARGPSMNEKLSPFSEDAHNILVAYIAEYGGSQTLRVGHVDRNGNLYSPLQELVVSGSVIGKPLLLEFVEFDPRSIAWNYDPYDSEQPFALVAAFENHIFLLPPQRDFGKGVDLNSATGISIATPGAEQILDIGYKKGDAAGVEGIYITYVTKAGAGTKQVRQAIYAISGATKGSWSTKLITADASHLLGALGVSADKRTAVSLQEKQLPFAKTFTLTQQTLGKTVTRDVSIELPLDEKQMHALPVLSTDHFGRFTLSEVMRDASGPFMRYSTVTRNGMRVESKLALPATYTYDNALTQKLTTKQGKTGGWHSAMPVAGNGILYIDETGSSSLFATESTDYAMDIFESSNEKRDNWIEEQALILTEKKGVKNQVVLAKQKLGANTFETFVIDQGRSISGRPVDFSHLTVLATRAGPLEPLQFEKRLVCEEVTTGYLAGQNGAHGWPLLDISPDGKLHLLQTAVWGPIGKDGVGVFDIVDGTYGNGDDVFLGWADILTTSGGTFVDANFKEKITNRKNPKVISIVLENRNIPPYGKDLVAYESQIGSDTPTRLAETFINTNTPAYAGDYYLSGDSLFIHTYTNEVYVVDLYPDDESAHEPVRLLPNPGVSYAGVTKVYANDGLLAIVTNESPKQGTYTYKSGSSPQYFPHVAQSLSYDDSSGILDMVFIPSTSMVSSRSYYVSSSRQSSFFDIKTSVETSDFPAEASSLGRSYWREPYAVVARPNKDLRVQGGAKVFDGSCPILSGTVITKLHDTDQDKDYYHAYDPSIKKNQIFTVRLKN